MKKKQKVFLVIVQVILFLLVLAFTNDEVGKNIPDVLVPLFVTLMFINFLIGLVLNRDGNSNTNVC